MEEEFEDTTNQGGSKRQNRKGGKKNKNQAAAGGDADDAEMEREAQRKRDQEAAMLAAGDGGDSADDDDDPIFGKKKKGKGGKKNAQDDNRRQRQGGKKGRKGQQAAAAEDDEDDEATKDSTIPNDQAGDEEEEKQDPSSAATNAPVTYPIEVVYCAKCGLPPEYCEWSAKGIDQEECKKWLQQEHPNLYDEVYPPVEGADDAEETKEDAAAAGKGGKKKKAKKVGFSQDQVKKIRVIKLKRGGKKIVSSIVGLQQYGCDLADTAKIFARKLGTGAASMLIEYKELHEQGIQVQGDVSESIEKIIVEDLAKFNIPAECIEYEDGGNKKNRTMGNGR